MFGKADGGEVDLDAVAAGSGGFAILGEAIYGSVGSELAAAGDVNGDGLTDLLIGAPFADGIGAAYVVFGRPGGGQGNIDLADVTMGTGGFKIAGAFSSSPLGDVNGDGRAELLVGAPYQSSPGRTGNGAAYVLFGKEDGATVDLHAFDSGVDGLRILGAESGDAVGVSVAGLGDVNGDGRTDLLVSATTTLERAGTAYVVLGQAQPTDIDLRLLAVGIGGVPILAQPTGYVSGVYGFGTKVAAAGDVNADGLADILVSAPYLGSGTAYVIYGSADWAV